MHCLYGLQQMGLSLELKGGMSLSKGLGVIDRFSEDIDIRIKPPAGQNIAVNPNMAGSPVKSQLTASPSWSSTPNSMINGIVAVVAFVFATTASLAACQASGMACFWNLALTPQAEQPLHDARSCRSALPLTGLTSKPRTAPAAGGRPAGAAIGPGCIRGPRGTPLPRPPAGRRVAPSASSAATQLDTRGRPRASARPRPRNRACHRHPPRKSVRRRKAGQERPSGLRLQRGGNGK